MSETYRNPEEKVVERNMTAKELFDAAFELAPHRPNSTLADIVNELKAAQAAAGLGEAVTAGAQNGCDGAAVIDPAEKPTEHWTLELDTKQPRVWFRRYHGGMVIESYRPASLQEAVVWAAAIIQGSQPPRALRDLDKPAD